MESRKTTIKQFLSRHLSNYDLQDDEDIFALRFVNSLLAIQLVQFIEKRFDIMIDDEDLELDNFRSVDRMDALIERKNAEVEVEVEGESRL